MHPARHRPTFGCRNCAAGTPTRTSAPIDHEYPACRASGRERRENAWTLQRHEAHPCPAPSQSSHHLGRLPLRTCHVVSFSAARSAVCVTWSWSLAQTRPVAAPQQSCLNCRQDSDTTLLTLLHRSVPLHIFANEPRVTYAYPCRGEGNSVRLRRVGVCQSLSRLACTLGASESGGWGTYARAMRLCAKTGMTD